MAGRKACTYTLHPETDKMLSMLSEREGLTKSAWISRQIRQSWDKISGSYLDEAIRMARLQTVEGFSDASSLEVRSGVVGGKGE